MNANLPTVAVAMSGGVDSSVAAALLVEQGYSVIGLMLRLWSEPGKESQNKCCTPDAMAQARKVAAHLGIPFYAIDAQQVFKNQIVDYFLDGYSKGVTPNPCLMCNRHIRWGYLLNHALEMGMDQFATGHYARTSTDEFGKTLLRKGVDERKDQSYVLSVLSQDQLSRTVFPVGGYTKPEIRELARKFGLSVASRQDSQDLCFLAGQDYREFLSRYAPNALTSGKIVDTAGKVVGEHDGLGFFTVGQRKGLGIYAAEPIYVIEKNLSDNTLVVGPEQELGSTVLLADQVNWIAGNPPGLEFGAQVKIRYKATPAEARVTCIQPDQVQVKFEHPLRDITPGQRAVFYQDDIVLGGGVIIKAAKD